RISLADRGMLRTFLLSLTTLIMLLSSFWALLALWFQAPGGGMGRYGWPALWLCGLSALLYLSWVRGAWWQSILIYFVLFALLMHWWASIKPSNQRDWADDLTHITTGSIDGRRATLQHVRNFNWRSQEVYDVRWESRGYDLSGMRSVDMVNSNWGLAVFSLVMVTFR